MPRTTNYQSVIQDDGILYDTRRELKTRRRRDICFCVGLGLFTFTIVVAVSIGLVVALQPEGTSSAAQCGTSTDLRINCIPEGGKNNTKEVCEKRGCCWKGESGSSAPQCFYPEGFGYKVNGKVKDTPTGKTINVTRKSGQPSQYGGDINSLRVDFFYETPYRLRVKVHSPLIS